MLVPTLALLVAGEIFCRVVEAVRPAVGLKRSRLTEPAYTSKPWFSEEFLRSSQTQPGHWDTMEGLRFVLPADYNDKYFTIADHVRRTTGFVPDPAGRPPVRVFVFGGSTTYCSEVPDKYTWCSQLQALLAAEPRTRRVEIVNFGVEGANSMQELARMEWEFSRGNIPQACIFYDGYNDLMQGLVNRHPEMTMAEEFVAVKHSFASRMSEYSMLFKTLRGIARKLTKRMYNTTKSPELAASLSQRTLDGYIGNLRKASEACRARGVHFAVFVQATVHTIRSRPLNAFERAIPQRPEPGADHDLQTGFASLIGAAPALRSEGVQIEDLTSIFEANDKPIFLDDCHVESDGNAIIAHAVYARLVELLDSWGLLDDARKP